MASTGIAGTDPSLGAGVTWPQDLAFDTWYAVVISWDAATGTSRLWLNPTCGNAPSITHTGTFTGTLMSAFAVRQASDYTGFIHVDDLVVGRAFADVLPGSGTFNVTCAGCAGLTQTATGSPNVGGTAYYSVPGAAAIFLGLTNTCVSICAAGCNLGHRPDCPDVRLRVRATGSVRFLPHRRDGLHAGHLRRRRRL